AAVWYAVGSCGSGAAGGMGGSVDTAVILRVVGLLRVIGSLVLRGELGGPHDELVVAPHSRAGAKADHVTVLVGGEHATAGPVEQLVGERRLELPNATSELDDVVLEFEHAADAFEADPL